MNGKLLLRLGFSVVRLNLKLSPNCILFQRTQKIFYEKCFISSRNGTFLNIIYNFSVISLSKKDNRLIPSYLVWFYYKLESMKAFIKCPLQKKECHISNMDWKVSGIRRVISQNEILSNNLSFFVVVYCTYNKIWSKIVYQGHFLYLLQSDCQTIKYQYWKGLSLYALSTIVQ